MGLDKGFIKARIEELLEKEVTFTKIKNVLREEDMGLLSAEETVEKIREVLGKDGRRFHISTLDFGKMLTPDENEFLELDSKYSEGWKEYKRIHNFGEPPKRESSRSLIDWYSDRKKYQEREKELRRNYEATLPKEMMKKLNDYWFV